jgi:hypothetical protein
MPVVLFVPCGGRPLRCRYANTCGTTTHFCSRPSLYLRFAGGYTNGRDNQGISAIKAAIAKPKTKSFPLIECEFPPLAALNKLGDGSMRSANEVDMVRLLRIAGGVRHPYETHLAHPT